MRQQLTEDDLREHLREQTPFLRASADSYDNGFEAEAKRMAVALRVLLHHTSKATSLLSQLNLAQRNFWDTSDPAGLRGINPYSGLLSISSGPAGTKFIAPLDDDTTPGRQLPFDEWWNQTVFIDNQGRHISRKMVVLTAANQDGGAHVDPALDAVYADLAKNNSLNWFSGGQTPAPIPAPERAAIQQIAHEVLKTLEPGYTKKGNHQPHITIRSLVLYADDRPPLPEGTNLTKIRRNERCPCNSGKKFKHCHGRHI